MRTFSAIIVTSAIALSGCSESLSESAYPPSGGSSYASASGSSLSSGDGGLAAPTREGGSGDYVVAPDRLSVGVALRIVSSDSDEAVTRLHKEMTVIANRLSTAAGGRAAVNSCGSALSPQATATKVKRPAPPVYAVTLESTIALPLPPPDDSLARSRAVVAVSQAMREIAAEATADEAEAADGDGEKNRLAIAMNGPRPFLADPEPHRAKLIEQWVSQTRAFAAAAESPAASLTIVDCTAPGPIEQTVLSSEEVVLRLPIACRIDLSPRATVAP